MANNRKRKRQTEPEDDFQTLRHPAILQVYDTDFKTWLNRKSREEKPITEFVLYSTTKSCKCTSDWVKRPIRSLVALLFDLQNSGYCLDNDALKIDNIVVSHDTLKLLNPKLRVYNESLARQNFVQLRKLILSSFFAEFWLDDIPYDMWIFLDLMLEENPMGHERLLVNNYALMNDKAKTSFIMQWQNMTKGYNHKETANHISLCDEINTEEPWMDKFDYIKFFDDLFNHRGIGYKPNGLDLLRFFRNALQHLIDYSWEGKDNKIDDEANYAYEDGVKMLTVIYPLTLSRVQVLLEKYELLEKMKTEEYFQ